MSARLPGPVGIWTAALDAGADHVCLQVLGDDPFDVPLDDWARLAPVVATLR